MKRQLALLLLLLVAPSLAGADVFNMPPGQKSIEFIPIGQPGNPNDPATTRPGIFTIGQVAYSYRMGKYDVTLAQYTQFLNAVAKTDTYNLYDPFLTNAN